MKDHKYILTDGKKFRREFNDYASLIKFWKKLPLDKALSMVWIYE